MATPAEDIEALMQQMNASAHDVASNFNKTLDYSDDSIQEVESILSQIHDHYNQSNDDSGLRGLALFFAAYIGEVIRRKGRGGSWSRNHAMIGNDSFPFSWNGGELFLYGWCLKRIFDGDSDNVWMKYRVCVLEESKN